MQLKKFQSMLPLLFRQQHLVKQALGQCEMETRPSPNTVNSKARLQHKKKTENE